MERGKLWRTAYKTTLALLERNLEGLTDELAARRPGPTAASPAWLLAHVYMTRKLILKLLDMPQAKEEDLGTDGFRGSDGETVHVPFSELVKRFRATDGLMKQAFMGVSDWDRPAKNPGTGQDQPLEGVIAFLHMHESYHIGQIALARKLLGLPGVM
ncbi:MAG TPA: DinB family protein [Holophagaceae bacterium]|nr:DinB family protein [Holophagaceae bacterium]